MSDYLDQIELQIKQLQENKNKLECKLDNLKPLISDTGFNKNTRSDLKFTKDDLIKPTIINEADKPIKKNLSTTNKFLIDKKLRENNKVYSNDINSGFLDCPSTFKISYIDKSVRLSTDNKFYLEKSDLKNEEYIDSFYI